MRDDMKFALVLCMGTTGKGRFPFDYGVCVVDGETAVTSFCDVQGLSAVVGTLPCVPSDFGRSPGDISFEAEQAAIDAILEAAEQFGPKYSHGRPQGYEPLRTMIGGGIVLSVIGGHIGFEMAEWVAEGAGWHAGDRVDLSIKSDGTALALHADRDGFPLVHGDRMGWLCVQRDWSLPPTVEIADGNYEVAFSATGEGVFMEMPAGTSESHSVPEGDTAPVSPGEDRTALPPRLPFDYRWSLVSLAALYGLLSLALKFV